MGFDWIGFKCDVCESPHHASTRHSITTPTRKHTHRQHVEAEVGVRRRGEAGHHCQPVWNEWMMGTLVRCLRPWAHSS